MLKKKNPTLAAILGFLFGPLGFLYINWKYSLMAFIIFLIFTSISILVNLDLASLSREARLFANLSLMLVFSWKAHTICSIRNKLIDTENEIINNFNNFPVVTMAMTDLLVGIGMFYTGAMCIYASLKMIFSDELLKGLLYLIIGTPLVVWTASFIFGLIAMGIDTLFAKEANNIFRKWK